MTDFTDESPALALRRMIFGHRVTQMITVATQLGLADQLGDQALTAIELALRVHADPHALYRLLRALASVGIVTIDADERFALTPIGACLRRDARDSQRAWVLMESADFYQRVWSGLGAAVHSGMPAAEPTLGAPIYEYLGANAQVSAVFQQAMADASQLAADAVVAAYPLLPAAHVVDVGGGYGMLLTALLLAHPTARGTLFERQAVLDGAKARIEAAELGNRCALVGGDFFAAIPAGGDVYILSRILMDHDDAHCIAILQNCQRAMAANARLLIIQQVLPDTATDPTLFDGAMSDLNMLVFLPGRERTAAEYQALLAAAHFAATQITPTQALMSVIEARPIAPMGPGVVA